MRKATRRIVVIGDLNGADDALFEILRGTGLVNRRGDWQGKDAQLVQLGDIFNRGGSARSALERLLALKRAAAQSGGGVHILLGNHEAMVALRNEAYCTEAEYLSFASAKQKREWAARVQRQLARIYHDHPARGPIPPLEPRLEAWKVQNVPGRAAFRRAVGPRGKLGRAIRQLPLALRLDDTVFVHAGLLPQWARLGIDGLNARLAEEWSKAKHFIGDLPRSSLFRDPEGPLWNRRLANGAPGAAAQLGASLRVLGAQRLVVGHTQTSSVRGGEEGRVLLRYSGRLVLADVGLASGTRAPRAALVIEGGCGSEWTPDGSRSLWTR